eukprot:15270-Prorocentrum_minimum.AAC.2
MAGFPVQAPDGRVPCKRRRRSGRGELFDPFGTEGWRPGSRSPGSRPAQSDTRRTFLRFFGFLSRFRRFRRKKEPETRATTPCASPPRASPGAPRSQRGCRPASRFAPPPPRVRHPELPLRSLRHGLALPAGTTRMPPAPTRSRKPRLRPCPRRITHRQERIIHRQEGTIHRQEDIIHRWRS